MGRQAPAAVIARRITGRWRRDADVKTTGDYRLVSGVIANLADFDEWLNTLVQALRRGWWMSESPSADSSVWGCGT